MVGNANNPAPLTVVVPRSLRHPGLRLFGLMLGVGFLTLLFVLLIESGVSTTQAAPSLSHFVFPQLTIQACCDEPGNLVPNPSFECPGASPSEPADWSHDTYGGEPAIFFRSRQFHHRGDYSVVIGSGSTESESWWRSKSIPAHEGRIYEFSVWVNAYYLSNKAGVSLTFWPGLPGEIPVIDQVDAEGTGNTSSNWIHLVGSHMAPPGTRYILLECHLHGAGIAWFDDAVIREYVKGPVLDLAQFDTPDPVHPGGFLVYTLAYSNTGNSTASNVVITDTFDTRVHFIGAVPLPTGGSGQSRFWRLSSLPVDGPHQIVITTTVDSPLLDRYVLLNKVEWRSVETATRWDLEETLVSSVPILTIDKTDMPEPVEAGQRLTYTIVYTNSGTAPMTGIFVLEYYPSSTVFITATPSPSNPPVNSLWLMPDLLPGGTQSVTIVMSTSVSTVGTMFNNILFDSNESDPVFVSEPTTVISGSSPPVFSMILSPEYSDVPAEAGKPIVTSYQLINTGSGTLTNIMVTTSPLQSWRGKVQIEPTYTDSLAGGKYQSITLTVQPATDEVSGTYLTQITAISDNASAHATVRIWVGRHVGVLVEPDNLRYARPCDQVTFTHWITNLGNFTDTIVVSVMPSTSWHISPITRVITDIGIRATYYPFTVTVDVPCTAQEGSSGGATVLATSVIGPPAETALDFIVVSSLVRDKLLFLPVVMRSYGGPDPFCNGDFEEPLSPCWTIESPPVERRCSSGGCWARLGTEADDTKCEGNISPTTAVLAQTFRPTATGVLTFSFQYEIHSLDVLSTAYDTLLVYVGATRGFTLTHRHEPYGCNNPPLIMSNTVEIPVFVANDVPITLKYSLVNDHWYNTYADIDNVRIAYAR